jgi:AraC-like DNA-binding protein
MFTTSDFNFDLAEHPYQLIHRHRTTIDDHWDMYHAHPGMEFIVVHEGNGIVIIDQNIYQFGPGTLIFSQPFQLHRIRAELREPSEVYVRSKFLFEPSLIGKYIDQFGFLKRFYHYLWQGRLSSQVVALPDEASEFSAILDLFSCRQTPGTPEAVEEFALFISLFFQFLKRRWHQQEDAGKLPQLRSVHHAEEIMRWIDSNFAEEFTLGALARELHLSPHHVSHLFHRATGSSITDYLISRRLREACWLLSTTTHSVQEIADNVGMTNVSYFCQLFKRYFGTTPSRYRSTASR